MFKTDNVLKAQVVAKIENYKNNNKNKNKISVIYINLYKKLKDLPKGSTKNNFQECVITSLRIQMI